MSMIGKAGLTTVAGAAGAAAAYMLDPERGRTRRAQARDQLFSRFNSTKSRLQKQAGYAGGMAAGAVKQAAPGGNNPDLNEAGLAQKVESIIFRPEDAPKGRVSVNAEGGVVFLRGEVETQEQIDSLVQSAGRVDGVEEVRNLMHLPGQPAPSSG
jgi:osmotically-inducible protein OsmY